MSNQTKNPIFWCLIIILAGAGLLVWGAVKNECIGPNCWIGSGFLMWSGGILLAAGLIGWQVLGKSRKK